MQIHRVAKLFPEMSEDQFAELVEDIAKNGQIEPILTCSDKVADGFHRYKACKKIGLEPKVVRWEDIRPSKDASLVVYVTSRNLRRRHLDANQRAAIANDLIPLFEEEAKSRQKKGNAAGGAKSKRKASEPTDKSAAMLQPTYPGDGTDPIETSQESVAETAPKEQDDSSESQKVRSADQAAKQAGVSTRHVYEARAIAKKSKELHTLIKAGVIGIPLAKKIAALEPDDLKSVLATGKRTGDYKQAYKEHRESHAPKPKESTKPPTITELKNKLLRATRQVEALNATLESALVIANAITVEKGHGLSLLITETQRAHDLTKQIAGE